MMSLLGIGEQAAVEATHRPSSASLRTDVIKHAVGLSGWFAFCALVACVLPHQSLNEVTKLLNEVTTAVNDANRPQAAPRRSR